MKHTIILTLSAFLFSLGALAQPKEISIQVNDITLEMVKVDSFYISKYPITKSQWWGIVSPGMRGGFQKSQLPIDMGYNNAYNIDYAKDFTSKIFKQTGLSTALPTVSEWMHACGPVPETLDEVQKVAWIDGKKHPVGQKAPNANGIYDMLGQIGEMVMEEDGITWCYIGGLPLISQKKLIKQGPSILVQKRSLPMDNFWPPTFRIVLKDVPEDCPGILMAQIIQEGDKYGLETEYGTVLKPEYDDIKVAEMGPELSAGGAFLASKNGQWGVFNRRGEALMPMIFENEKTVVANIPFLEFVSYSYNYKQEEERLATTKGEFEKTADFEARKADPALQKAYVDPLMKDFEARFISTITQNKRTGIVLLDYDADKEVYRFKVNNARTLWTVYELSVPIDAAPAFKEYMQSAPQQELLQSAEWGIVDDCAQILRITFTLPDGRSFTYSK